MSQLTDKEIELIAAWNYTFKHAQESKNKNPFLISFTTQDMEVIKSLDDIFSITKFNLFPVYILELWNENEEERNNMIKEIFGRKVYRNSILDFMNYNLGIDLYIKDIAIQTINNLKKISNKKISGFTKRI